MTSDARPHVVFVLSGLTMGGAEAQLASVLEADRAAWAGVRLSLLTLTPERHPLIVARLEALGVPVATVDRTALAFPAFFSALVRWFRSERPALVHCFLAGSAGTWGRAAALAAGVPHVLFSDLSLAPTTTRAHRLLTPFLHRRTARFLPNARAIAERLVREGAPPDRVRLVRNGVDLARFDPEQVAAAAAAALRAEWGAREGDVVAGFLGMLRPVKRPDLLLEAVLALPEDARPAHVAVAGDGPLMADLRARVEGDAWARAHVHLPGVVDDVAAFLAAVDFVVLCSDTEGLPNAVLEAFAMGRPVVATSVSDVPELVGEAGLLARAGDAADLGRQLAAMTAATPAARAAMGAEGQARVRAEYGLAAAARRFWDAHDDLLQADVAPDRPDVALFLPSRAGGGAERVLLDLAGAFAAHGRRVDLVLATEGRGAVGGDVRGWADAPLPDGVRAVPLGARRLATALPALVRYLRRVRPTALLATLEHANAVALLAGRWVPGLRVVVREANTVGLDLVPQGPRDRLLLVAMRRGYRRAAAVVAVSQGVARAVEEVLGVPPAQVVVIENPAVTPRLWAGAAAPCAHPWLGAPTADGPWPVVVGVGRLAPQKAFDVLLRAFAALRRTRPARLVLLGEGPARAELAALAAELGVADDVSLPGFVPDPFAHLARAAAFASSSAWEGMPNALIQARALGLPCVATDCPSGPAEVLDGGREGWLVPVGDHVALAAALAEALDAGPRPPSAEWLERFELDAVATRYLRVLEGTS